MALNTKGIKCPFCKVTNSQVISSRLHILGRRRRYECRSCLRRFTTIEFQINRKLLESKSVKSLARLIMVSE